MAGDYGLSDLRFDGYGNAALANQVDGLRNGAGPETLNDAMSSLISLATGLKQTDATLRKQLKEIGVTWQGESADGGTSATESASIYAEQAQEPVVDSAKGVDNQSMAYFSTRHGAPEASTLRGPTQETGFDQFAGFFGHTTDHAQQVKETNAARNQAIDAMNGYQQNSSDSLSQSRALPVPPGMNLVAQPVDTSTHVSGVGNYGGSGPGGGFSPAGAGPGGGPNSTFNPGGGPVGPVPTTGTPPVTGAPPVTGVGPLPGGAPVPNPNLNPLVPALRANPLLMAEAATMMGSGAASGAGAGAERDRLANRTPGRSAASMKNGVPLGAAPAEEARAARNAEKFGARPGRPGGSIMQPAAAGAGRSADGEDDQEHVRRYGVESSDVFEDDRVVAPESIGDDDG